MAETSFSDISHFVPTIADVSVTLPEMIPVQQVFPRETVEDIDQTVRSEMAKFAGMDLQGKRIAVTAGSRGISCMIEVLQSIVAQLKDWGAEPFVVPAMGSHGGGTAEGQVTVLKNLGITESSIGAPIKASMDVVELGQIEGETPVCCDRIAYESDGIVVCNRIKAHPGFVADFESGLVKMMVIGLGKHAGTERIHRLGFGKFNSVLPEAASIILEKAPVIFGVGVVDNAYNKAAHIEAIAPDDIFDCEKRLLQKAKSIMGRLLVSDIDLLIVDEIGKEVTGAGMDSNVTGRSGSGVKRPEAPSISTIVLRDLSKKTAGNATGMGLADLMCLRAVKKVNLGVTYTNTITAGVHSSARIPVIAKSDRDAITLACHSSTGSASNAQRIVQIQNTKELDLIWLSTAYLSEIENREDLIIQGEPRSFEFDDEGNMLWPTRR